jgi:hypothetical protein
MGEQCVANGEQENSRPPFITNYALFATHD